MSVLVNVKISIFSNEEHLQHNNVIVSAPANSVIND